MNLFHYALREVFGRPARTALNALGVAIGLALVIVLFSITLAYQQAITFPFTAAGMDFTISRPSQDKGANPAAQGVILPAANQAITGAEIERLAQTPNVGRTLGVLQVWSFDPGQFKVVVGIDPDAFSIGPAMVKEWIKSGRSFSSREQGVAMVESHFARFYGLREASRVKIAGKDFAVGGIYEVRQGLQLTAANIYIPLSDAQALAKVGPDTFNTVYVKLKDPNLWKQTTAAIRQEFPDFIVTSSDSALAMSDSMLTLLNRLALPAAVVVLVICVLFVYRSLAASTWEKIGEIGTQKAVGWSQRDIRNALTLELFIQVALGAALGLVLGALGTSFTGGWEVQLPQLGGSAPPLPGAVTGNNTIHLPVIFPPWLYISGFAASLMLGFFIAIILAKKAAGLKPTEAWRSL
ncbi:MAG: ABC transporter permease [Negativicutes bacterium]|nr:ABC transporter permease [Negativicutes bacterium]